MTLDTALLPLSGFQIVRPSPALAPIRLVAIAAADSVAHPQVIQSLAAHASQGERLGVLVGHNRFDVYALAQFAKDYGADPRTLLAHVDLSRAFTLHQLHQRIVTLDGTRTRRWSALYVLGLLDTFYDEDVKPHEAKRLLRDALTHLKALSETLPVFITVSAPSKPGREYFLDIVARGVELYTQATPTARQLATPRQLTLEI